MTFPKNTSSTADGSSDGTFISAAMAGVSEEVSKVGTEKLTFNGVGTQLNGTQRRKGAVIGVS